MDSIIELLIFEFKYISRFGKIITCFIVYLSGQLGDVLLIQSELFREGMRLMSSYEIGMLILTALMVVMKLIDMNNRNHKK